MSFCLSEDLKLLKEEIIFTIWNLIHMIASHICDPFDVFLSPSSAPGRASESDVIYLITMKRKEIEDVGFIFRKALCASNIEGKRRHEKLRNGSVMKLGTKRKESVADMKIKSDNCATERYFFRYCY